MIPQLRPRQWLPVLDLASASWEVAPAALDSSSSAQGRGLCRVVSVFTAPVVAPRSLWRLPPPASVASSFVFTVLSSIIPTPVKTAPASLCRVVSCLLFSAPERVVLNLWRGSLDSSSSAQAVAPSPRPYLGLLGGCPRRS